MKYEEVNKNIIKFHYDRNLIHGATDWTQTKKLLEEFIELVASQMPDASSGAIVMTVKSMIDSLHYGGRIKMVKLEDAPKAKLDAIGDMGVVQINIAERNESSLLECLCLAYDEIKDRKGRMINGSFVKDGDL